MALKNTLDKDNNEYKFNFTDVYYKIDELWIEAIDNSVRIGVRGYPDEYSRQNDGIGIYKKIFDLSLDDISPSSFSKNDIILACYEYLKTLDEFKNSTDV